MTATLSTSTNGGPPCPPHVARFVDALSDPATLHRIQIAADQLQEIRRDLLADRTLPAELRAQACREIARRECRHIARLLHQCCKRFNSFGTGAVFLPRVRAHVIADALNVARSELLRASDPAVRVVP